MTGWLRSTRKTVQKRGFGPVLHCSGFNCQPIKPSTIGILAEVSERSFQSIKFATA
jgi:hypothetical protein